MYYFRNIKRALANLPGTIVNRKIIVFESDDWGSIRMPSRTIFDDLAKRGLNLGTDETRRYNLYDTLATSEDLNALFESLTQFKDQYGNHPVFTAMSLVANPDFDKIKESDFQEYHWESLENTFERYNITSSLKLWQQGRERKVFHPEFHGREHLNVSAWMRALQQRDQHTILAFERNCWGFNRQPEMINYQAAFDLEKASDLNRQHQIITEGLDAFERLHGYRAKFFVPPNGPFNNKLQSTAEIGGLCYLSTAKIQIEPFGGGKIKKHFHYLGKRSKSGLTYLTRNASFEPSSEGKDWVTQCLQEIKTAFFWKKPAIISTHRVNYIGVHDKNNRFRGLDQLEKLLKRILSTWPDVVFLTSSQLGDVITKNKEIDDFLD